MAIAFFQQLTNATRYSLDGLKFLLKSEFAARIELYFFLWLFPFLIFFELPTEYILSTLILFLLLLAVEALNTAIEVIVDRVSPEISSMAKQAKDLGSFAVMAALSMNILHLAFAVTKLNLSKFEWGTTLFVSAVFFLLGLYLAVDKKPRRKWKLLMLSLTALYLLGTGVYIASNYFTGVGFDSKVIYHLKTGLKGAGFGEYLGLMIWMTVYCVIGVLLTYFVADLLGKKKHSFSQQLAQFRFREISFGRVQKEKTVFKKKIGRLNILPAGLALSAAFLLNPFAQDISELVRNERISAAKITDYDSYVQPESLTLSRKRNIVFVYLESLERTYFDTEIFPGLVPNLSKLESEHIGFTDMRHAYHTEWTIAGVLSSQCGVPLYTSSNGNAMSSYDNFMPNALCLGDILKKNGYYLEFINGGDSQFAGKDKFFNTHGFDTILGKKEHQKNAENTGFFSTWGLHDDRLLDLAYDSFIEKSKGDDPFGLFALTVDTHHPKGHVSTACKGIAYQDGKNEMLNAIKCSDLLVTTFIKRIQESEFAKDTLIIVMSDHMAMENQASDLLKQGNRRNFFMIIDPYTRKPVAVDKPGSSIDVAPTVLSFLGYPSEALGFGRNLLGPENTIMEDKGKDANRFLISMKKSMEAELWEFPKLSDGLVFDMEKKKLHIGDRSLSVPVFLSLNENDVVDGVRFFKSGSAAQDKFLRSGVLAEPNLLWIDRCGITERYLSTDRQQPVTSMADKKICAVSKTDGVIKTEALTRSASLFTTDFPAPQTESMP